MLFVIYFMYFPLSKLFKIGKITKEQIEKMIYIIGTIQLILFTIFFISSGKLSFLKYEYDYRYGSIRLREKCCIINLLFVLTINNYINSREKNKNLILIIFNILVCALIIKTRLLIASYIGVLIISLILWKKNLRKKIFFVIATLLIVPIIVNSTIIKDTIDTIFENDEDDIRKIGKAYYIEQLKYSPFTGRGYINTQCEKAVIAAGINENIYLVDNGIYAVAFEYGMVGILWFLILWLKMLNNSIKKYNNENNYIGLAYLIYLTILLPNITWWSWTNDGMIAVVIILSTVLEEKIEKDSENEEEIYRN